MKNAQSKENLSLNKEQSNITPLFKDEYYHVILELYQLTKEPSLDFVDNAMKFSYSNQGNLIKQWKFANNLSLANCLFIGDVLPDLKKKKPTGNKNEKNEKFFFHLLHFFRFYSLLVFSFLNRVIHLL